MNTKKQVNPKQVFPLKHTVEKPFKGKYSSVEAASLAKMESARDFIAAIDLTLVKKNGHVE